MAMPRSGLRALPALLGALAVGGAVSVPVLLGSGPAAAGELERFESCAALAAWEPATGAGGGEVLADAGRAAQAEPSAGTAAPAAGDPAGAGTGDTNVVVEGVDELDVVDRVDERHALVAAGGRLSLVDVVAGQRRADLAVPHDARLTFDPDAGVAWVAGATGEGGTEVTRVSVTAEGLVAEGTWTSSGSLVDARRTGDRLHVVAVDHPGIPGGEHDLPFPGGPVPCDQVLRPSAPSGPGATLLVSLPAAGAVEPLHAAEVVGSGPLVHLTQAAAYLATPLWEGAGPETSIHRFDLDGLTHTGSGRVEGTLLDQFSMSEHEEHLRLALIASDGGDALNHVVVLDTDGELEETGRTERFGHPGETLHGIRFAGTVAYAVTFLTTDPFYVVDVADPSAPRVVGEVELPGFSSYLHPLADGLVAGFGPDGDGRAAVKLFDVADPSRPRVVDSEVLGDASPVVWDHHAFLGLGGGRFAVPATTWATVGPARCAPLRPAQGSVQGPVPEPCISPPLMAETTLVVGDTAGRSLDVVERLTVATSEPATRVLAAGGRWALLAGTRLLVVDGDGSVATDIGLA